MKIDITAHSQLLLAPWRQRHTEKAYGGIYVMAALLLVLGALIGFLKGGDKVAMASAYALMGATSVLVLWLLQIMSFLQLNSPAHARTVPRQLRTLRETVVAFWILSALVCGSIMGIAFGNTGSWILASAMMLIFMVASIVWPARWLLTCALLCIPLLQNIVGDAWTKHFFPAWISWPVPAAMVILSLGARVLTHSLVRDGDAKHATAYSKARNLRLAMMPDANGRQASLHQWGDLGTAVLGAVQYPWRRYMEAVLRKPEKTSKNAMARVEIAIGSEVHWILQLSVALVGLVLAAVACLLAAWFWGDPWVVKLSPFASPITILILPVVLMPAVGWHSSMLRSQSEQKLLMLLPGVPRGGELNRALARSMLVPSTVGWFLAATMAMQLDLPQEDRILMASMYLGMLPMIVFQIQDWSRIRVPRPPQAIAYMAVYALASASCYALQDWLALRLPTVFAVFACGSALMLWVRWQKLEMYPSAFPSGRFADRS